MKLIVRSYRNYAGRRATWGDVREGWMAQNGLTGKYHTSITKE